MGKPSVKALVQVASANGIEVDDAVSAARLQAMETHKPESGVPFNAWVVEKLRGELTARLRDIRKISDKDVSSFSIRPNQFRLAFKRERRRILNKVLNTLSPESRILLRKMFWQDATLKELSLVTGMSQSVIHQKVADAMTALRRMLLHLGFEPEDLLDTTRGVRLKKGNRIPFNW